MVQELKHGDKVLFTTVNSDGKIEGRFIGYSNINKYKCIVEYGGPFAAVIAYALTCEKKPEPKKITLHKEGLLGMWVKRNLKDKVQIGQVTNYWWDNKTSIIEIWGESFTEVNPEWEYTKTPQECCSWNKCVKYVD